MLHSLCIRVCLLFKICFALGLALCSIKPDTSWSEIWSSSILLLVKNKAGTSASKTFRIRLVLRVFELLLHASLVKSDKVSRKKMLSDCSYFNHLKGTPLSSDELCWLWPGFYSSGISSITSPVVILTHLLYSNFIAVKCCKYVSRC